MSDNDIITNEEAKDVRPDVSTVSDDCYRLFQHARIIERTTMAVKIREDETTTTVAPTTQMPEHNSINVSFRLKFE